jgi:hypothetical protein
MRDLELDASALIHAKRKSKKRFEKLVAEYRQAGFTDKQMLDVIAASPAIIDCLGSAPRRGNTGAK